MRLTLQVHHVSSLDWSSGPTALGDGAIGRLLINRADLAAELLRDRRLTGVHFELVQPGESCRILAVSDIVEPRAKLEPAGRDFPGALTGVQAVGFGTTRVLRGMAVTVLHPNERLPGHIVDMRSGGVPGHSATDLSRFARLHHLVVVPQLAEGVLGDEAENALRMATLRASAWLARTVEVGQPDAREEFTLQPVSNDLPRVAYVYQLHSHQRPTVPGEPLLYGDNCRHLLPTILHPNEVLDGAVLRAYGYFNMETYGIQNHGVISDLYARHAIDLNFVGVVVYVANQLAAERERATLIASNLVRYTLQADGAVFTKSGGGAPNVDMALIADRCESLGVKTSLILWETGAPGASDQDATLFNWPSLDAIVSIGASQLRLDLDPVERVVAPDHQSLAPFYAPMHVGPTQMCGATDHLGAGTLMGVRY